MIRFTCSCGKHLQVGDELAGTRVACPGCRQVQVVPLPQADVPLLEAVTPAPGPPARSGKATISLVLGLVSALCNVFTGLLAVIFGLVALLEIQRSGGRLQGKGFALVGIFLGVFWSLVCLGAIVWGFFWSATRPP